MDNSIPFPQADDFSKIISLLNIPNEKDLSNNQSISMSLGEVTNRQVLYYLSAASFLGLVNISNGQRKFTPLGIQLRTMNSTMQEIELICIILQSPIFNKVFVNHFMIGKQTQEDVAEIIKTNYPEYRLSICERRAQTVLKWVEYIAQKFNPKRHI